MTERRPDNDNATEQHVFYENGEVNHQSYIASFSGCSMAEADRLMRGTGEYAKRSKQDEA